MDAVKYALAPLLVNGKLGRLSETHTLPDTAIDARACVGPAGGSGTTDNLQGFIIRTGSPWILSTSFHIQIYQNNGSLSLCVSYEPIQRPAWLQLATTTFKLDLPDYAI